MADQGTWPSNQSIILVQEGGAGNKWRIFDLVTNNSGTMSAIGGGGQATESRYARDLAAGAGQYRAIGRFKTGNPDDNTFTLNKRLRNPMTEKGVNRLRQIFGCRHGVRVQALCGDARQLTNFTSAIHFPDTTGTAYPTDQNMAVGTTQEQLDVMQQIEEAAATRIDISKVIHLDIKGTVSDVQINRVIAIGVIQCAGDCGGLANDGNQDFLAVTNADASPGHGGASAPRLLYTTDGGTNWSASTIDDFTGASAHALDVEYFAGYVLVVSAGAGSPGVAYARLQDIKDGVSLPWAPATGLVVANPPRAIAAAGATIYAAGANGYIYSGSSPFAFSTLSAGTVTSNQLNTIGVADEFLVWFGGNSGTLLRYLNGSLSAVTVAGLTGNITRVRVPQGRGYEVYVATSTGQIWRSRNATATTPTWEQLSFDGSGTGSIVALEFDKRSPYGDYLYVVQTQADGRSRVLWDLSGGAMDTDAVVVGTYADPVNVGITDIAPSDPVTAISVGNVISSYGFIGKVQAS